MTVATKLTPKKREKFLLLLSELGNVTRACVLANISREAVYKRRKLDKVFSTLWAAAVEIACDALEDEAWRRGKEGIQKPLQYQGQLTGHMVQEYSDTLLIFLLKGNKPEKFADRHKLDGNVRTENTVIYLPSNSR